MKRLFPGVLLFAACLYSQAQPDITRSYSFTSATPGAAVSAQAQPAVAWRLTYYANSATAFSALSIQLEGAPDVNGVAPPSGDPSWTLIAATITQGTNPLTDTARGTLALTTYYPWVRVNITTLTGSGTVHATLLGYKGTSAAASTGGGSGSGVIYCAPASASGTAYTCTPSPALTSYASGVTLAFVPDVNGTGGATTVAVSGLVAKSVKLADGTTDPTSTSLVAGQQYYLAYDGTVFRIGPYVPAPFQTVTWILCAAAVCSTLDVVNNPFRVLQTGSTTTCYIAAATPPTGTGGVTVQVIRNGGNAFTASLASGTAAYIWLTSTPSMSRTAGDTLTAAITAVGGTTPGQYVTLTCNLQ